jgi:hypothetical protein
MSPSKSALCPAALLALTFLVDPATTAAAPSPRPANSDLPIPKPAPDPAPPPAPPPSFVGRLAGSGDIQGGETDLGVITGIRYTFSNLNQNIAISATKAGKSNLCVIQFHSSTMNTARPGWTRAEPLETYREIVAAARTPGGKILCVAPIQNSAGSIDRVSFNGTFLWVTLGDKSWHEFQIVVQ